jgi:hypothetical protein
MNNNSHGFDLPHFLRKPVDHIPGKLDDTMDSYQPLLAAWLIEMALALRWCAMVRPGRLPAVFEDDDFLSITGITPPKAELGRRWGSHRPHKGDAGHTRAHAQEPTHGLAQDNRSARTCHCSPMSD